MSVADFSMPLVHARAAGDHVLGWLRGAIETGVVAGSVRREKPRGIHDVDVVVSPKQQMGFLGNPLGWSHEFISAAMTVPRFRLDGIVGEESRQLTYRSLRDERCKVEVWCAQPENYGWILLIRTGPGDFGKAIMSAMWARTLPVCATASMVRSKGGFLLIDGKRVETPTEESAFAALGLPFIEPRDRAVDRLCAHLLQETAA